MTIELNITQGEWRASSEGARHYVTTGRVDVAKVYEQVDPKTAGYNAQLMAMAPKLYEVLDELCRAVGNNSLSDVILAKARAVDILEAARESCPASEQALTASPAFGPDGAALGKPLRQLLDDKFKSIDQDLKEVPSTMEGGDELA